MTVKRSQTLLVFEEGTPQSTIDWHVKRKKACAYWTSVPPSMEVQAKEESWVFPKVIVETWDEEVPE